MSFSNKITGIIEGFYGQPWSWQYRQRYARFLSEHGFNTYIYAPKCDPWLRKQWREPWPEKNLAALQTLRQSYRRESVNFGLGFSPFELYRDFDGNSRLLLDEKLRQIEQLKPDVFCILFDDMRGDLANLAAAQLAIIDYIAQRVTAKKIIVCPTYYSDDAVLEDVFGTKPANYLEEFGRGLDEGIEVFWTGEKVCSASYSAEHLLDVERRLGKKPLIWDNYPVNDGRLTSDFLHIEPPQDRNILAYSAGLLANPMNQPVLSTLPLAALGEQLFGVRKAETFASWEPSFALRKYLEKHLNLLQFKGLSKLGEVNKRLLLEGVSSFDEAAGVELRGWLAGEYVFDPSCLTE